jgi:hypothetical protein
MKLYNVGRTDYYDYDEYIGFVVCAKSEEDTLAVIDENIDRSTWAAPQYVVIEEIGTAKKGLKRGIILDSFCSG